MAIDNPRGFEWAGNLYGGTGGAQTLRVTVGTGQTINAGDPVIMDDGAVDLSGATPANIYGIAQGFGESGDEIEVIPALPGYLWRVQTTSLAATDIGNRYALVATTGEFEVDTGTTTNGAAHIVRLDDTHTPGNEYGSDADAIVQIVTSAW